MHPDPEDKGLLREIRARSTANHGTKFWACCRPRRAERSIPAQGQTIHTYNTCNGRVHRYPKEGSASAWAPSSDGSVDMDMGTWTWTSDGSVDMDMELEHKSARTTTQTRPRNRPRREPNVPIRRPRSRPQYKQNCSYDGPETARSTSPNRSHYEPKKPVVRASGGRFLRDMWEFR